MPDALRWNDDDYPRVYVPADEDDEYEAAVALSEYPAIPQTAALFEPPTSTDKVGTNPLFVRRYLVVLSASGDDLPVGLFEYPDEAVEFARDVRNNPNAHADRYLDAINPNQTIIMRREWVSVSVIEFSGPVPMCRTELFSID